MTIIASIYSFLVSSLGEYLFHTSFHICTEAKLNYFQLPVQELNKLLATILLSPPLFVYVS